MAASHRGEVEAPNPRFVKQAMTIILSLLESRYATTVEPVEVPSMAAMAEWFQECALRSIAEKSANQLVIPASFSGNGRKKAGITGMAAQFWMDFDNSSLSTETVMGFLEGVELLVYTTSSAASFRLVLSASRGMTVAEYEHLSKGWSAAFNEVDAGCGFDPASSVASQPFYLPSNGATVVYQEGSAIDVDALLAENPVPAPVAAPKPVLAVPTGRRVNEEWVSELQTRIADAGSGLTNQIYRLCIDMLNACGKDKDRALHELDTAIRLRGSKTEKHRRNIRGIMAKLH